MMDPIIAFLKQQLGNKPAVVGISGGVDSAVVAALLTRAMPPEQIYSYYLPSSTNQVSDLTDSRALAEQLGIHYETIPIDPLVAAYAMTIGELNQRTVGNLKARVRMTVLYAKANSLGGLVVGTGNKTELQLGYFTKYGDGGVDLLPIAHLYKTQIWELAKQLQIPTAIIEKAPTAGLWEGQTDEAELGVTYANADAILSTLEQAGDLSKFNPADVTRVQELMNLGKHKQAVAPHL